MGKNDELPIECIEESNLELSVALLDRRNGAESTNKTTCYDDNRSLFQILTSTQGPLELLVLCMAYSFAVGATIGVVPTIMTDQYARLYHGYQDSKSCSAYSTYQLKPTACIQGSDDAQTSNTTASFASNILTFLTSSIVGSFTDKYGRKNILLVSQAMAIVPSFCLVYVQLSSKIDPGWYYLSSAFSNIISWIAVALSSISDVIPKKERATCFGLLLSSFSVGFATAPSLALKLTHFQVSMLSFFLLTSSLIYATLFLKETLPYQTSERVNRIHAQTSSCRTLILRPLTELTILNRDNFFRVLSCLAFFSGISSSGNQSVLIYYLEEYLAFDDGDVAKFFVIAGFLGIAVQAFLLKVLLSVFGERHVVVIAFMCGAIHNTMYAFASSKSSIFMAVAIGTITGTSFPVVSAMKSNNVEEHEQGRIQGALYALTSLAAALGPLLLRVSYQASKHTHYPGSFFLVGTFLYVAAAFCALLLPKSRSNTT